MTEVSVDLKAKDQMSSVLDHVTQRLGIFNAQGLSMGIAFAGINIAVGLLQQAFSAVMGYINDGVEANRRFEASMARLSASSIEFAGSMTQVKTTLKNFSVMFATDLDTLTAGLQGFIREGYSSSQSVTLLWEAERLAITSGNDLATTQDVLIRAFHEFNLGAGDASDVVKKLNDITSITGMSLGDIDIILGRVADAAQKSGISFDNLINLMYTLHETGTSNRFLASELTKQLENLGNVKINPMPDSTATSIDAKFKKITGTVQFTIDMMKQLGTISQMDLTGGLDLGALFPEELRKEAQSYFDTLNKQGITTLKQFNDVAGQTAAKKLNPDFEYIGIDKKIWQLIRTMYQYNDMLDTTNKGTTTWKDKLAEIQDQLNSLNSVLTTQNATLAQTAQDIGDLTEMRAYTYDMRNATLAVQAQEDAVKSLQRVSDAYALSQMRNSLEIMKIQYNADERHGLTRDEKEKVKALEKANAGLQIQEQENQMAVAQIQQNGLRTAQDSLDQIRRDHDSAMYDQQIRDLDANIKAKNEIYSSTLTAIAETNKQIAVQQALWQANQLVMTVHWAKEMRDQLNYAYGGGTVGGIAGSNVSSNITAAGAAANATYRKRRGYATGGLVTETAPALLHKGEFVVPKEMVSGGMPNKSFMLPRSTGQEEVRQVVTHRQETQTVNKNVTITVHADLNKDTDVEEWGRKLGAGLSSGFLEGTSSGTTTVTSRKGGTIIVPGTTVTPRTGRTPTATIPVLQPLKSKGRFRVG